MKLWKGATFAFMLCGAALSILLLKNMATLGQIRPRTKYSLTSTASEATARTSQPSTSSSSAPPSAESAELMQMGGPRRVSRSADNMNSLLSDSMMFQSFTEGELKHMVGTLLDRKRKKSRRLGDSLARRTKRARRPRPCSVRELELTVSELGLGYDSDETVLLRYCSGQCTAHRHNYDITMEHMMKAGFKGRRDKVSKGPCCRPTAFEKNFSFLDNKSRYHTIHNVSAKNCGCV
uniref:Neurturin n=1 Tax=Cynoglossus semilaevis TaxID=244447 RepID=A0A3P8WDX0_CYNSE